MPDVKQFRVRHAKPVDRPVFCRLWKKLLETNFGFGSFTPPTETNVEYMARFFDAYTSGEMEGVVLLVADKAVCMWGAGAPTGLDTTLGKQAVGWGIYMEPELQGKGVSRLIRETAIEELKAMGFTTVVGIAQLGNEKSIQSSINLGFKPNGFLGVLDLITPMTEDEKIASKELVASVEAHEKEATKE